MFVCQLKVFVVMLTGVVGLDPAELRFALVLHLRREPVCFGTHLFFGAWFAIHISIWF